MPQQQSVPSFWDHDRFSRIKVEACRISPSLNGMMARPSQKGPSPAMIIFMEAFGINMYIQEVLRLVASQGILAIAPDLFDGQVFEYDDRERAIGKLMTLKDDVVLKQTQETLEFLSSRQDVQSDAVGAMGFCMGGRLTFLALSEFPEQLKAGVSFYGGSIGIDGIDRLGRKGILDHANTIVSPMLFFYGAKDPSILPEEHGRIAKTMSQLNRTYFMGVFPDAGHAFFNWHRDTFVSGASTESWEWTTLFLNRFLTGKNRGR
ncbi:MAG: dienelactone hydrolase family protein [Leptospirales bacterium]